MTAAKAPQLAPAVVRALGPLFVAALKPLVGRLKRLEAGANGGSRHLHILNGADGTMLADVVSTSQFLELVRHVERLAILVGEIEQRRRLAYRGPHEAGEEYAEGDYVTQQGALWHANETTRSRPGTDPAWTLAVKSGEVRR